MYSKRPRPAQTWLPAGQVLAGATIRRLIVDLRRAGGEEILVRRVGRPASGPPTATRLRKLLGPDFFVRQDGRDIYARARRVGEPELELRRLRMSRDWMTLDDAAAALRITHKWLHSYYLGTGRLARYRFGARVLVRRAEVEALVAELPPGGAVTGRREDKDWTPEREQRRRAGRYVPTPDPVEYVDDPAENADDAENTANSGDGDDAGGAV